MSAKTQKISNDDVKETLCLACGGMLRSYSILVCAECLDDECSEFMKLADSVEIQEQE